MEKKIWELLEAGEEAAVRDDIAGLFDSKEIREMTMDKIHHSEKRASPFKRSAAAIFAAAVIAALSFTACAAYRSLTAERFEDYFGELTEPQAEVVDQIGTGEMPASMANGTTITPLAAIGDERYYYARFRIEAPEGTCFGLTEEQLPSLHIFGDTFEERCLLTDEKGTALAIGASHTEWIDETPDDNVLECVIRFESDLTAPVCFNDGTSKLLTIRGIWLEGPDKKYTKLLEGPWSFDIGLYGAIEERVLDVDGLPVKRLFNGMVYEDEGMSMTLRAMALSPLGLFYAYDFTCPDPLSSCPGPGTVHIVMKDGSTVGVLQGEGTWTASHVSLQNALEVPIDLDEAAYVQFGGQQIPVN